MSLGFRTRLQEMTAFWESIPEQDRKKLMEWCPISDELVREKFPNQDVDKVIERMDDDMFRALVNDVLRRYRLRRKKSTARYLRQEGRNDQAQQLEDEIKSEEVTAQQESA